MTTKRIEQLQEDHAAQAINSLVMTCRARFIRSADLVGIRGPAIDHLQRLKTFLLNPFWISLLNNVDCPDR